MKHLRGLLFVTIMVIVGLQLTGCEKMPNAPLADVTQSDDDGMGVDKIAGITAIDELPYDDFTIVRTWKTSKKINYRKGGWIGKRNIGYLYVPPFSMSSKRNTRIYAQADLTSKGDLIFTFDPSGLEFTPNAKLVMNFRELQNDNVSLWNWNGSKWVKVSNSAAANDTKFKWDRGRQRVTFDIEHFSIYLITKD